MSDLRKLCGCGHVRNSHDEDGVCSRCACQAWRPAYHVLDSFPPGVEPLQGFVAQALNGPRDGLTLVQCRHWDKLPNGLCRFCRAEASETRPVKRLVFAPQELTLV